MSAGSPAPTHIDRLRGKSVAPWSEHLAISSISLSPTNRSHQTFCISVDQDSEPVNPDGDLGKTDALDLHSRRPMQ